MSTESYAAAAHHASADAAPESKPHAHFDAATTGKDHEAKHHIHARAGDALLHRGEMDQPEARQTPLCGLADGGAQLEKAVDAKRAEIERQRGKVLALVGEVMRMQETYVRKTQGSLMAQAAGRGARARRPRGAPWPSTAY